MPKIQKEDELRKKINEEIKVEGLLEMPVSPEILDRIRKVVQSVLEGMDLGHITFIVRNEKTEVFIEREIELVPLKEGLSVVDEVAYEVLTGFAPENDDLERANCENAGETGHLACGLCSTCGKPTWTCSHLAETLAERRHS
jgi:hypothetical protein